MPQPSIAYAVGRVRAHARRPLGEAQLERLLSAATYEDALRMLTEMGWPDTQDSDVDTLSIGILEQACGLLRDISPQPELTDTFLLRHDARNLKALLKARILGVKPEGLSRCGTIPLDVMRHAVTERDYKKLPEILRQAIVALEKQVALDVDPMAIDVRLDQALYSEIASRMKTSGSLPAKRYFEAKVDFHNAVALLRLNRIPDQQLRLSDFLLPGGTVGKRQWQAIAAAPETLPNAFKAYDARLRDKLRLAQQDGRQIPALEKAVDDYLLALFRPLRNEPFSVEALLGWLLAFEREAGAVRLIMAGKLNGFQQEQIRERLRAAYGR